MKELIEKLQMQERLLTFMSIFLLERGMMDEFNEYMLSKTAGAERIANQMFDKAKEEGKDKNNGG